VVNNNQTIGFTGARKGMTLEQKQTVEEIVQSLDGATHCVHGDCIGADADFHDICVSTGLVPRLRPCTYENMRAYCEGEEVDYPKRPMQRNRDIVAEANVMIACPPNYDEIKSGSGTWATIKFSRRAKKPLYIIYPDGSLDYEIH